jgi:hypothetical protein
MTGAGPDVSVGSCRGAVQVTGHDSGSRSHVRATAISTDVTLHGRGHENVTGTVGCTCPASLTSTSTSTSTVVNVGGGGHDHEKTTCMIEISTDVNADGRGHDHEKTTCTMTETSTDVNVGGGGHDGKTTGMTVTETDVNVDGRGHDHGKTTEISSARRTCRDLVTGADGHFRTKSLQRDW